MRELEVANSVGGVRAVESCLGGPETGDMLMPSREPGEGSEYSLGMEGTGSGCAG